MHEPCYRMLYPEWEIYFQEYVNSKNWGLINIKKMLDYLKIKGIITVGNANGIAQRRLKCEQEMNGENPRVNYVIIDKKRLEEYEENK